MKKVKEALFRTRDDIRAAKLEHKGGWTTVLQAVVHSWNVSLSAATGVAPATVFFGRRVRHPSEARMVSPIYLQDPHLDPSTEGGERLTTRAALERREAQQVRRHAYFDRDLQRLIFPPGTIVRKYIQTIGAQNQAMLRSTGPYLVLKQCNDTSYILGHLDGTPVAGSTHGRWLGIYESDEKHTPT